MNRHKVVRTSVICNIVFYCASFLILLLIAAVDLRHKFITKKSLICLLLCRVGYLILVCLIGGNQVIQLLLQGVLACFVFGFIFGGLYIIKKDWIGKGDIYLCVVGGFCFGFYMQTQMIVMSLLYLLGTSIFCYIKGKGKSTMIFPYAPFYFVAYVTQMAMEIHNLHV